MVNRDEEKIENLGIIISLHILLHLLIFLFTYLKYNDFIISLVSCFIIFPILNIIIGQSNKYYIKRKEDKEFLGSFTDLEKFTIDTFISAESTSIFETELQEYIDKSLQQRFYLGFRSLEEKGKASQVIDKVPNWIDPQINLKDKNQLAFNLDPKVFEFFRIKK